MLQIYLGYGCGVEIEVPYNDLDELVLVKIRSELNTPDRAELKTPRPVWDMC